MYPLRTPFGCTGMVPYTALELESRTHCTVPLRPPRCIRTIFQCNPQDQTVIYSGVSTPQNRHHQIVMVQYFEFESSTTTMPTSQRVYGWATDPSQLADK